MTTNQADKTRWISLLGALPAALVGLGLSAYGVFVFMQGAALRASETKPVDDPIAGWLSGMTIIVGVTALGVGMGLLITVLMSRSSIRLLAGIGLLGTFFYALIFSIYSASIMGTSAYIGNFLLAAAVGISALIAGVTGIAQWLAPRYGGRV